MAGTPDVNSVNEDDTTRAARTPPTGLPGPSASDAPPEFAAASLAAPGEPRYQPVEVLGEGGCGRVYSMADRDLARTVAMKVLLTGEPGTQGDRELLAEARVTAALEHPGVVPIHDIGRTADGRPYFTMRRISGQPLNAVRRTLTGVNDRVTILLKLCDVLGAAHHQGVVHCDVKPANIMLGEFGELLLVDWGIATSEVHGPTTIERRGTPEYMSPEQARTEHLTAHSDIFAAGAVMFWLFTGRPPLVAGGDDFWERKRDGLIDPPTAAESASFPPALLAIALKALHAEQDGRYATVGGLAEDLRRFQAGQSVSAYRDPLEARVARWLRAHGRRLAAGMAVLLALAGIVAFLYGERLKSIATWGAPRFAPSFAGERWRGEWTLVSGGFRQDGDALVTTDKDGSVLLFNQRLVGPSAIEFTGRMLPEGGPCDLSVTWYPQMAFAADGRPDVRRMGDSWRFQVGAFDNVYCGISGPEGLGQVIRYRTLLPDRDYRIRAEVDERRLALYIDGELVCEHHAVLPFAGGNFAIYGYHPGKRFSEVRVYSKGVPERLGATAIGDAFADKGNWADAAEQYARVIAALPDRPVADEARFRLGICHLQVGNVAGANQVWQPLLAVPRYAVKVRAYLLERRALANPRPLVAEMRALCRDAHGEDRDLAALAWHGGARQLVDSAGGPEDVAAWVAVRQDLLADDDGTRTAAARLMLQMRRPQEVLASFPTQRWLCADALMQLGDYPRVLREYGDLIIQRLAALSLMGDYQALVADPKSTARDLSWAWRDFGRYDLLLAGRDAVPPVDPEALNSALIALDRPLEVLASTPSGIERLHAQLATGHLDEVLASGDRLLSALALLHLGRTAEVQQRWPGDARLVAMAQAVAAIDRLNAAGPAWGADRATVAAMVPPVATIWDLGDDYACWQLLLVPFIREQAGEADALAGACRGAQRDLRQKFHSTVWHAAGYLLGDLDRATFLNQPLRVAIDRRLALLDALRAERAGRAEEALRQYRAWPGPWPYGTDPVLLRFVRWRIALLSDGK